MWHFAVRKPRYRLGLSSLLLAFIVSGTTEFGITSTAFGQCLQTGNDVVCNADDVDGFELNPGNLDTFTVDQGVTVTAFPAPPLGAGPTEVVFINDTVVAFTNFGVIAAGGGNQAGVDIGSIGAGGFLNSGTISGSGSGPAVYIDGDVLGTFTNTASGIIFGDSGFYALGTIAGVNNAGSIDGDLFGVGSDTRLSSTLNNGSISGGDVGLGAPDIGVITNHGTIFGVNNGVQAFSLITLRNYGLIDSFGDGIDVDGGDPNDPASIVGSIENQGTIRGNDDGIDVGTLTSLINSGSIIGGFEGAPISSGIAAAVITDLVNSGLIMTGGDINHPDNYAIEERDAGDTALTLNAGSILIGRVDLGGGGNTLNIGPGLSLNSTFEGDNTGELPTLGNTSSALIAILDDTTGTPNSRQVVAGDRAVFETLDETVFNLLAGIDGAVEPPSLPLGFAAGDLPQEEDRWRLAVFGGYSHEELSGDPNDVDHWSTGILAGFQLGVFADHSVELFGGVGLSNAEADADAHELQTLSLFAGLNGRRDLADYDVRWGLTTGILLNQAERSVANNLVAGGLERAKADYTGFFLSPDLEVSTQVVNSFAGTDLFGWTVGSFFEPSLALGYTGVFANGYTETGTTNPLTLDSRTLHLGSARGTVTLPFERTFSNGQQATLRLTLGTELRARVGDDSLTGTLLGQSVSTTLDEDRFDLAAIAALDYEQSLSSRLSAFAQAETRLEVDGSFGVQAQFGLRGSF